MKKQLISIIILTLALFSCSKESIGSQLINHDLLMQFQSGDFLIEYYEMGATEPTRTKTITR